MTPLGIYIHFPWCRALCPYCDFPVAVARGAIPHEAYLAAVLAELSERAGDFAGRDLVSIYFGGGTPSLWPPEFLARAVLAVAERFSARPAALEITLEANPTDCVAGNLAGWQDAGINRLSIGVQSAEARTLLALGRDHRMGDGLQALAVTTGSGAFRVSADIIIGTPGCEPGEDLDPSVPVVADSGAGHISVYELTIEERTAFGKRARAGLLRPLDEDLLARLYTAAHHSLTGAGYEHYEISSYALPGQRAVHNQLYWHGGEYLGLGTGAASFRVLSGGGAERVTNRRGVRPYLAGADRVAEREILTPAQVATDRIWLGLRTVDGVPAGFLAPALCDWLLQSGLAELFCDRVRPTLKGFLYADHIAARVVAELGESG